jgi:2-C-methyl-D-erythritol 2,4-cyclodiphosphate synthase
VGEPRFGLGFDTHPADPARPLRLGGVTFDGQTGLAGHSDADVVCHALADALLGAAGLGDLGERFPEDDPDLEGIPGLDLLGRTVTLLDEAGFRPSSCDLVILAEAPTIAPRREEMVSALASVLGIAAQRVSVKATRPEGLGLSGDGAGCMALAVIVAR